MLGFRLKLYYLNDEKKAIVVRVLDDNYDHTTGTGDKYATLAPASGQVFDIRCPEGSSPYVKKWTDLVMISYISPAGLAQLEERLQQKDPL